MIKNIENLLKSKELAIKLQTGWKIDKINATDESVSVELKITKADYCTLIIKGDSENVTEVPF